MEANFGEGGVEESPSSAIVRWKSSIWRGFYYYLDKSTLHILGRWLAFVVLEAIYVVRVYSIVGFYIVSYGLGIFILNLLIGFKYPQADPEMEGQSLPTKRSDEFKPFIRRLPEFKFWFFSIPLPLF